MKVGIVGAGITGIAATHYLAENGIESIALEASEEPGGVISTKHVDGRVLEAGPQRMRKTPGIAELATTAGIEDTIIETDEEELYVYANGTLGEAPLSARKLYQTDLLSRRGKARLLLEPLTSAAKPTETVEEVFVRKFGREAYERFIGPLYGGLYGSDPAEMPAAFALEGLMKREQEVGSLLRAFRQRVGQGHTAPPISFDDGNQQLPNALYERYSDRIELNTPVREIECLADGAERTASGYLLETPTGTYSVDQLILTTPAMETAELLAGIAEEGHVRGIDGLEQLRYNPLALVYIDATHDIPGKGYQVGLDEDLHTLGVSWNSSMFGREGVQTVFLGGMHEPELVTRRDEELSTIACEEFETVVGVKAEPIDVERLDPGFPAWDTSWKRLEELELPENITLATNYTARMGIPSRVREARSIANRLEAQS